MTSNKLHFCHVIVQHEQPAVSIAGRLLQSIVPSLSTTYNVHFDFGGGRLLTRVLQVEHDKKFHEVSSETLLTFQRLRSQYAPMRYWCVTRHRDNLMSDGSVWDATLNGWTAPERDAPEPRSHAGLNIIFRDAHGIVQWVCRQNNDKGTRLRMWWNENAVLGEDTAVDIMIELLALTLP
jgi:hypothetical protein